MIGSSMSNEERTQKVKMICEDLGIGTEYVTQEIFDKIAKIALDKVKDDIDNDREHTRTTAIMSKVIVELNITSVEVAMLYGSYISTMMPKLISRAVMGDMMDTDNPEVALLNILKMMGKNG